MNFHTGTGLRAGRPSLGVFTLVASGCFAVIAQSALAAAPNPPIWMDAALSPDDRATLIEREMTLEEKIGLLHGRLNASLGASNGGFSAGRVSGVPRLGIPDLVESDASLGVSNIFNLRPGDTATALPSGAALAATFNPKIAYEGGVVVGSESRLRGYNVHLAGGVNLVRDPRNGRNFEYLGEDPLLAGTMGGESIRGLQSQHLISTVKHYAVNDQETGRNYANAVMDEAALRESDLLAFEIAIEKGNPLSVMCSYNLVNGSRACDDAHLLKDVLKGDWGFKGYVMSDWGAVYSTDFALNGLDQQSGEQLDRKPWFGAPLKQAVLDGAIPQTRVDEMVHRVLRSMFAAGLFDTPPVTTVDLAQHSEVAKHEAEEGIVLLKNIHETLPITGAVKSILVVGGHADAGVLSGGGSTQVRSSKQDLVLLEGGEGLPGKMETIYHKSSPLVALRKALPGVKIDFDNGRYAADVAARAKTYDLVIVFATQWMSESFDAPDLSLPSGQDGLIDQIASSNSHTFVVLETGGPVTMPWLDKVCGVLEAWYPGQRGGEAIAEVLTGAVNPSGRLPISFPKALQQYPRSSALPGRDVPDGQVFDVTYSEGADVGYKWLAKKAEQPLFPFGYGLSYSTFAYGLVKATAEKSINVSFIVTNDGKVPGQTTPQVYLNSGPDGAKKRLIGFSKVDLAPGQSQAVSVTVDPRLLANFDANTGRWIVAPGRYKLSVANDASDPGLTTTLSLERRTIKP